MNREPKCYVLGNGVKFHTDEIEFLSYLKIRKVERLSVFELAGLGAKGFKQWALIEPFCYKSDLFEIASYANESQIGYDALNRAWLLNTLLVVRNHTQITSIASLNRSWNDIKDLDKSIVVQATLCDYHVSMIDSSALTNPTIDQEDIRWISTYFEIANVLANKNEKFRYALNVINSWRYCVDLRSAIAIVWAALESIVDVSSEITYRLSLSLSSLLKERGESRITKFKEIKSLYTLRSKVVHGSDIKIAESEIALAGSLKLLFELITYIIESNKMVTQTDFTNAIFL
ncbi:hypothetical protein SAMN05661099_1986 [Daejeonella lutea]|uniref:Uncharacterized protein n=2 Tax=Daejeonella lutea TaxID=572036 RepID=A0A1T5CXG0_9SPHI|nr:hypothetical protein SAMN05661099_1986 [Daejeonella lutea]